MSTCLERLLYYNRDSTNNLASLQYWKNHKNIISWGSWQIFRYFGPSKQEPTGILIQIFWDSVKPSQNLSGTVLYNSLIHRSADQCIAESRRRHCRQNPPISYWENSLTNQLCRSVVMGSGNYSRKPTKTLQTKPSYLVGDFEWVTTWY